VTKSEAARIEVIVSGKFSHAEVMALDEAGWKAWGAAWDGAREKD
jgi:hypothetical protein